MHQPMVCSTTLKTTESCSVWLVSGVQSIMMEKNVAFFTLLTISSSTLSPISAMISFWIWLQRKFHFIFFVFNSPQMFVHDRIKLSSIPTVIGNCHYVGHIEHLYALIMPGSFQQDDIIWQSLFVLLLSSASPQGATNLGWPGQRLF